MVALSGMPDTLWRVATDGSSEKLGEYPDVPSDLIGGKGGVLDGEGRLIAMAQADQGRDDVLVRRSIDGTSKVIYTEADMPLVMLHISWIFSAR